MNAKDAKWKQTENGYVAQIYQAFFEKRMLTHQVQNLLSGRSAIYFQKLKIRVALSNVCGLLGYLL